MTFRAFRLAAVTVEMSTIPAFAHYSFAMFVGNGPGENRQRVAVDHPHSWIMLTADNTQGPPEQWAIEMGGSSLLTQQGWFIRFETATMVGSSWR
jgi:hypothetical protein